MVKLQKSINSSNLSYSYLPGLSLKLLAHNYGSFNLSFYLQILAHEAS